eukprot:Hpha_TRINITY_DN19446_c0_g1::TRINITY_DN19446_c0_g1_i1::g.45773::m.45773
MGEVFTTPLGERELKGVAQPVVIHIVLPRVLAARWTHLQQEQSQQTSPVAVPSSPLPMSDTSSQGSDSSGRRFSRKSSSHTSHTVHHSITRRQSVHLKLGLTPSDGTCATVRGSLGNLEAGSVRDVVQPHNATGETQAAVTRLVVAVETAALRTQGQVVCVASAVCVMGWNAGMRCSEHVAQTARFLTLLPDSLTAHAGAASGRVLSGNISGTRRRHVTVAGGCVEHSIELAQTAITRGIRFVAAGGVGERLG